MNASRTKGKNGLRRRLSVAAVVVTLAGRTWAQDAMDHSKMDHGQMSHDAPAPPVAMDHPDADVSAPAPPAGSLRDPDAYADGNTLDGGDYVLSGPHELHMVDQHSFGHLIVDRLERVHMRDGNATAYDIQGRFGSTYDAAMLKAEGESANGKMKNTRTELLWSHAYTAFWDAQLGVRHDGGVGPDRTWAAFGFQGLAPYWFDIDAAAYVGENGRTALRLAGDYELPLMQRLVLQPRGMARTAGDPVHEMRWVAGVRAWF